MLITETNTLDYRSQLFVVTADKKIEELLALRKTLDRKFYLLVRYFGEGSIKAEELFEIFTTLLRQFEVKTVLFFLIGQSPSLSIFSPPAPSSPMRQQAIIEFTSSSISKRVFVMNINFNSN